MSRLARSAALAALADIRRRGAFASAALDEHTRGMSPREAALAHRLVMTVIQHRPFLEAAITRHRPAGDIEPILLDILTLGAAQLFFFERVPKSAAINEAVKQAKAVRARAAGMVNAVLRALSTLDCQAARSLAGESASVRLGLPDWLISELPEGEAEAFADAVNRIPPVTFIDRELNVTYHNGPAERSALFRECVVADEGALTVVKALAPEPGQAVWDTCAAPGGKSIMSAFAMKNSGYILASDISEKKLERARANIKRLRADIIETIRADARVYTPARAFHAVLCDVPCSGLGALAKKPDIRLKDPASFASLPALQLSILANASKAVLPGGRLVYSTCTFRRQENEEVTRAFLQGAPGFSLTEEKTLWPHIDGTDGFYYAVLVKI